MKTNLLKIKKKTNKFTKSILFVFLLLNTFNLVASDSSFYGKVNLDILGCLKGSLLYDQFLLNIFGYKQNYILIINISTLKTNFTIL